MCGRMRRMSRRLMLRNKVVMKVKRTPAERAGRPASVLSASRSTKRAERAGVAAGRTARLTRDPGLIHSFRRVTSVGAARKTGPQPRAGWPRPTCFSPACRHAARRGRRK